MNEETVPRGMVQATDRAGTQPGYMPGFGNDFETEALPGALPQGQNSPQKCAYGLYAEQLSGTAFTAPPSRARPIPRWNRTSWTTRCPSCSRPAFRST